MREWLLMRTPDGSDKVHNIILKRSLLAFPRAKMLFSTGDPSSVIAEMNKEMASIFGETPAKSQEYKLSHIDSAGEAQMVDVSAKESTQRRATAKCKVVLGKEVFEMLKSNQMAKGDVLTVAKVAGINGAKQTSSLIPLCHNIPLSDVRVDLALIEEDHSVEITGQAATTGKTGVEMEAMTAATIAGLTVYDMCKAASKYITITDLHLEAKSGGKTGNWTRG